MKNIVIYVLILSVAVLSIFIANKVNKRKESCKFETSSYSDTLHQDADTIKVWK